MFIVFQLPGTLPSLNEIIEAAKKHWGGYKTMKEENTEFVRLKLLKYPQFSKPVEVNFLWYTPDLRQDPDNISAAQKFIFDGLVAARVLPNDNRRWVKRFSHNFDVDRKNPRVEVVISEVE